MLSAVFIANCLVLTDLLMIETRNIRELDRESIARTSQLYLSELEQLVPKITDRLELLLETRNEHTDAMTGVEIRQGLQSCHEQIIGSPYDIQRYLTLNGRFNDLSIEVDEAPKKPTETEEQKIAKEDADPIETGRRLERALTEAKAKIKKLWRRPPQVGAMFGGQTKAYKSSTETDPELSSLVVDVYLTPSFLVGDIGIVQSSGSYEFDLSAKKAVERAKQFSGFAEFSTKLYNERLRKFTIKFRTAKTE